MLRTYLSRSGSVDISLDIDLSSVFNGVWAHSDALVEQNTFELVSGFLPFSQQWRHLFVAAPFQYLLPVLSLVERGQVPHLKSLSLDFSCESGFSESRDNGGVRDTFSTVLDVSHCGRLSALTVYGNADDNTILRWRAGALPSSLRGLMLWNVFISVIRDSNPERSCAISLCRLSLGVLTRTDDLLRLLEASPNLEDLTLDVQLIWPSNRQNGLGRIIHLNKLRRLRFSADSSTSELLGVLQAHSLSFFELSCRDVLGAGFIPERPGQFLQRSVPPLVFFMISDLSGIVREMELIDLLRQMPTIEDLRVVRYGLTDAFLQALTMAYEYAPGGGQALTEMRSSGTNPILPDMTRDMSSVCPRLAGLTITEHNHFSPQAIICFLLSRCLPHDYRSKPQVRAPSAPVASPPSTVEVQGQSFMSDITGDKNSASISEPVVLRSFQFIFQRRELITQHPLIKICMKQGLELKLTLEPSE